MLDDIEESIGRDLTWPCHFCGRVRPDALISVVSRIRMVGPGSRVEMKENRRYCNDSGECIAEAAAWTKMPS